MIHVHVDDYWSIFCYRPGDKPLPKPMMTKIKDVIGPQWVKTNLVVMDMIMYVYNTEVKQQESTVLVLFLKILIASA